MATQTLVGFVIRTRRIPSYRSRPSRAMVALPIAGATVGAVLPFTPLTHVLGFTTLPLAFFGILLAMIAAYLVLVEIVKARFYATQVRSTPAPTTAATRQSRHLRRRAARFVHRPGVGRHPRTT